MSNTFFEIEASQLYDKTKKDVIAFIREPIEDNLFNALFSLYHLREWVYPDGYKSYKDKRIEEMTSEQRFHNDLHKNTDYEIIRQLCNRAKHVKVENESYKANLKEGLIVGYARAGDRLGQKVFLVEDRDVRSVMESVLEVYKDYFSN